MSRDKFAKEVKDELVYVDSTCETLSHHPKSKLTHPFMLLSSAVVQIPFGCGLFMITATSACVIIARPPSDQNPRMDPPTSN